METMNQQISSFFLMKTESCKQEDELHEHGEAHKHHVHHTHHQHTDFELEEIQKRRKNLLLLKQKERQEVIFNNKVYKLTRREIIFKCSVILHMMIQQFMKKVTDFEDDGCVKSLQKSYCQEVKQSSVLFNE